MHRVAKIAVLCCLAFVGWGYQPAAAGCQVISATHSAPNRLAALQMSQALAVENANNLRSGTTGRTRDCLSGIFRALWQSRHQFCPAIGSACIFQSSAHGSHLPNL